MAQQDLLRDAEQRMKKTRDVLERELAHIRTGRASPSLVEELRVDYYGTPTPLKQMASITAPEPRMLVIQPWDRSVMPQIERAIRQSDLGVSPAADGNVLRLPIPPLTEQRRKDMAKLVRKRVEDDRVALRNVRRDVLDHLRRLVRDKQLSEDDERRAQDQLQKLTDRYVAEVDRIGSAKEAEVMEV
jgi:ribosome recycling factor